MSRLRILHFITELQLGGAQRSTLNTLRYLSPEKYDKYLISSKPKLKKESLEKDFSEIPGLRMILWESVEREVDFFKDIKTLFGLFWFLRKNRIDIIHTHSSKAGIIGRWAAFLAGTKVVIHTIHGFPFNDYQLPAVKKFYIWLEKITAGITTKLIAISGDIIIQGLKYHIGNQEQYILIRDAVDLELFLKEEAADDVKQELGIAKGSMIIGSVACLKPQKGLPYLIRALSLVKKEHSNIKLFLVGDGKERGKIENLIEEFSLKDEVTLLGWRKDVFKIMKIFDIIVLSSLWEGLPLTALEAMAAKKPLVASRVNGICEIIKDGENGLLVDPGDYQALADKISLLLTDKHRAQDIGAHGYYFIRDNKEFKQEAVMSKIKGLYDELFSK